MSVTIKLSNETHFPVLLQLNGCCEFATSPQIPPAGAYWLHQELSNSPDPSPCFTACCKARVRTFIWLLRDQDQLVN